MGRMRIIIFLALLILLFSYTINAEESKEAKTTPDKDVEIEVLKERIKGNEEKRNIQLISLCNPVRFDESMVFLQACAIQD